jgi:hypothetical protein
MTTLGQKRYWNSLQKYDRQDHELIIRMVDYGFYYYEINELCGYSEYTVCSCVNGKCNHLD